GLVSARWVLATARRRDGLWWRRGARELLVRRGRSLRLRPCGCEFVQFNCLEQQIVDLGFLLVSFVCGAERIEMIGAEHLSHIEHRREAHILPEGRDPQMYQVAEMCRDV